MIRRVTGAVLLLAAFACAAPRAETVGANREPALSPEVRELLRAEMREVATGTQQLTVAIAGADWATVAATANRIRASYIMAKRLSSVQRAELEGALPERFKLLDAGFHDRAGRLAAAATAHDAELTAFHYSRLVETCTTCHAEFARTRFPGFAPPVEPAHRH